MRILIVILSTWMGFGNLYSQNSFYIVPSLNNKFGICSTNGFFQFSKYNPPNDYFEVINKSFHYAPGIRLGLGLGWKNQTQKFTLDFSWNQDVASISNETVYLPSNGDSNYYFNAYLPYNMGLVSNRFSLNFNKPILKDLIDLHLGIGFIQVPGGKDNYEVMIEFDTELYDSETTFKRKYTTRAVSGLNLNLSIGFNINLKWNNNYLFTLSTIYSQGMRRNLVINENYYEIQNLSTNETIKYSYASASKGSGVFIQISRKFQLFPWKAKHKSS